MTYRKVVYDINEKSCTHQSFKDECDIRNIMKKYKRTGIVTHINKYNGQYGDFISAPGYHEAMNQVCAAQEAFDTLPAVVRKRFGHDPAEFLDFVHNPANVAEMRTMGLMKPEVSAPNVAPLQASEAIIT